MGILPAILYCQMILGVLHYWQSDVQVVLVLGVGKMDPMATRVRRTLLFCLCFFLNLLAQSPPDFIESSCFENPFSYSNDAYPFSIFR